MRVYQWIIDTLTKHRHGLTYKEISDLWDRSARYSFDKELPNSTFRKYVNDINQRGICKIDCGQGNNIYKIVKFDVGYIKQFERWLLDSFALSCKLDNAEAISDRILLEPLPTSYYIDGVIYAMRHNKLIEIEYKEYGADKAEILHIEPYCIKTYHNRWYILGKRSSELKVYCLDRVENLEPVSGSTFTINPDFDAEEYFAEYYGVRLDKDVKVERVVLRAHLNERFILERQPIHHSQKLIARGDNYADFELTLRPTFDFVTYLESQGRFIEVLEPQWLRKELVRVHSEAIERNKIPHDGKEMEQVHSEGAS